MDHVRPKNWKGKVRIVLKDTGLVLHEVPTKKAKSAYPKIL